MSKQEQVEAGRQPVRSDSLEPGSAELGRLANAVAELLSEHAEWCSECAGRGCCSGAQVLSDASAKLKAARREILDAHIAGMRWAWPR